MLNNPSFFLLMVLISGLNLQATTMKFAAQDSPPFNYAVGNKVMGASQDIMTLACRKLHWDCQLEIVPQKRALTLAQSGIYDGVWGIAKLPEREKYLTYTSPTWTAQLCYFMVKAPSVSFVKLSDLQGFTLLGVRSTASYQKALEHQMIIKDVTLMESNSYPEAFDDLFKTKYGVKTAVASYIEVGRFIIEDKKFNKIIQTITLESVKFRVGFSKKVDPKIIHQFDQTLNEMHQSGELKKILADYKINE